MLSEALGFKEVYGVNKDYKRVISARNKGLRVVECDLETEPLPFPDDYFDFVTSFGVLEHLKFYDNLITEARRVLKPSGLFFHINYKSSKLGE